MSGTRVALIIVGVAYISLLACAAWRASGLGL
jgi:hypothetical protein